MAKARTEEELRAAAKSAALDLAEHQMDKLEIIKSGLDDPAVSGLIDRIKELQQVNPSTHLSVIGRNLVEVFGHYVNVVKHEEQRLQGAIRENGGET